jgi:sulfite exporter TauE/SafE
MVQLSDDIVRFEPPNLDNAITNAGALFGFLAGLAWITSKGGFSTDGQRKQRLARYILGLVGVLILWYGLGVIFPRDVTFIASLLRYIRYTLVGGWIAAGAPYLFLRLHLAEKANLPEYATDMQ